ITHTTLAYFGIGRDAWFISVPVAIVVSLLAHTILEQFENELLLRVLSVTGFIFGMSAAISFNWLRSGLFMLLLQQQLSYESVSPIDDGAAFYKSAAVLLAFAFVSLAVATEIATGLLFYRLIKSSAAAQSTREASEEMSQVVAELMTVGREITAHNN